MDDINSIPGKLFYTVYQMYKDNTIDARGKVMLKDLIIVNSKNIYHAYEEYVKSGTQLTLRADLFRILKQERDFEKQDGLSDRSKKSRKNIPNIIIPKTRDIQKIAPFVRQV